MILNLIVFCHAKHAWTPSRRNDAETEGTGTRVCVVFDSHNSWAHEIDMDDHLGCWADWSRGTSLRGFRLGPSRRSWVQVHLTCPVVMRLSRSGRGDPWDWIWGNDCGAMIRTKIFLREFIIPVAWPWKERVGDLERIQFHTIAGGQSCKRH